MRTDARQNLARYLKEWRKTKSVKQVAQRFGVTSGAVSAVLRKSKRYISYRKCYQYAREPRHHWYPWLANISNLDKSFVKRWALKLYGIKKLGGKCSQCGNDNHFVLDFHHIDEKNHSIQKLVTSLKRKEFIQELDNCIILCSNCHREHHRDKERFERYKDLINQSLNSIKD